MTVDTVVFDIGNVLIRWDPDNLYRHLIADEAERAHFHAEICPYDWNLEQDRGRPWAQAVAERAALHPQYADLIRAYDERWQEMLDGEIEGTVAILHELHAAGTPLYAITNFSREKWAEALELFDFPQRFRDIVVSAHEGLLKPDPAIYQVLFKRNGLDPAACVFIDDSLKNVEGARAVGMQAIPFISPEDLREKLADLGLPLAR